jgi:AcrR family transcriptional regulator
MARTRQRITTAAIGLHGTVGPGATTMSAVAERAGVTRATLYRHFPNEEALFAACSREWLAAHPRPSLDSWAAIADPVTRIQVALRDIYGYYATAEAMLGNLLRDVAALPAPIARNLAAYPGQMLDVLDVGWRGTTGDRIRRAAILHAVAFETWRSLVHEGLSSEEAADLLAGLVVTLDSRTDAVESG